MPIHIDRFAAIEGMIAAGRESPAPISVPAHRVRYDDPDDIEQSRMQACELIAVEGEHVAERLDQAGVRPDYRFDTRAVPPKTKIRNLRDFRRPVWLLRPNDLHDLSANQPYVRQGKTPGKHLGSGFALRADGKFAMYGPGRIEAQRVEVRQFEVLPERLVMASWMNYGAKFRTLQALENHVRAIRWNLARVAVEQRGFEP